MSVVSNVYLPIYIRHTFPPFSFESDIMQTLFTKFNLEFAFFDFTLKFDMHFFICVSIIIKYIGYLAPFA